MMEKLTLRKTLQEMNNNLLQRGLKPSLNLSKKRIKQRTKLTNIRGLSTTTQKILYAKKGFQNIIFLTWLLTFWTNTIHFVTIIIHMITSLFT